MRLRRSGSQQRRACVAVRITREAKAALDVLAERWAMNYSDVIEVLLEREAEKGPPSRPRPEKAV